MIHTYLLHYNSVQAPRFGDVTHPMEKMEGVLMISTADRISTWLYLFQRICSSSCLFFWSWSSIDIKVCQMHLEKHWSLSRGRNLVRAKELNQLFNWIHTLDTLCIFFLIYVIGHIWTLHAIVKRLSCFFDVSIISLQLYTLASFSIFPWKH